MLSTRKAICMTRRPMLRSPTRSSQQSFRRNPGAPGAESARPTIPLQGFLAGGDEKPIRTRPECPQPQDNGMLVIWSPTCWARWLNALIAHPRCLDHPAASQFGSESHSGVGRATSRNETLDPSGARISQTVFADDVRPCHDMDDPLFSRKDHNESMVQPFNTITPSGPL